MTLLIEKAPTEVVDVDISARKMLKIRGADQDSIKSISVLKTVSQQEPSTQLIFGPDDHPLYQVFGQDSQRAKVWVGGGTDGVTYESELLVETQEGRKESVELRVKVKDKVKG